ncbi:energy transducer TonB [Tenacibaculum sp. 1_MG-2023]|uniref:energy transducer TonB n=1 Tax=Tenacibaculum sp. 1_MG-2023 TaxID=3062653 RepID=UPI0026E274C6|nr:energy transducer TonB [Tenacibaculum sp. 1_MG-2023]MDO6674290.1 energy transducer TonB [Tenacibaculum sp. 1_MG-2023]
MRKVILVITIFCFYATNVVSQREVCETPEESLDLNSITKCTIAPKSKKNKGTRQISVKVSANRRYLKKREISKKKAVSNAAELSGAGTAAVEGTTNQTELNQSLTLKNNLEDITSKLSAEEVRKAEKFTTVDRIPLFSACKKAKKNERLDCFNVEMVKHIQKHFKYPSQAVKESIQGEVWVRFIIDKNGQVKNIKTLGPKNGGLLNNEAVRVVSQLPQFIPAKKSGDQTSVKYGFPIMFALDE